MFESSPFILPVGSEVHHLQSKISELSGEVDNLREEKTKYQMKAGEMVCLYRQCLV